MPYIRAGISLVERAQSRLGAHSGALDCGDYCSCRDDHPIRSFAQRLKIEASIEAARAIVDRVGDHRGAPPVVGKAGYSQERVLNKDFAHTLALKRCIDRELRQQCAGNRGEPPCTGRFPKRIGKLFAAELVRNDGRKADDLPRIAVGVDRDHRFCDAPVLMLARGRSEKAIDGFISAWKSHPVVIAERLETKTHLVENLVPVVSEIPNRCFRWRLIH